MSLRNRRQAEIEAFPPGVRLVWSEAEGKLVLQAPKNANHPPPVPQQSASHDNLERGWVRSWAANETPTCGVFGLAAFTIS